MPRSRDAAPKLQHVAPGFENLDILGSDLADVILGFENRGKSTWAVPEAGVPENLRRPTLATGIGLDGFDLRTDRIGDERMAGIRGNAWRG
jgi:hypothetical protein